MIKEKGWKPLPTSLKVLFVFLIINTISSFLLLLTTYNEGYPLFGFNLEKMMAISALVIINIIGSIIFILALWNRYIWAWKYGIAYFTFFIINTLISSITLTKTILELKDLAPTGQEASPLIYISAYLIVLVNISINLFFIISIYKKRNYFN